MEKSFADKLRETAKAAIAKDTPLALVNIHLALERAAQHGKNRCVIDKGGYGESIDWNIINKELTEAGLKVRVIGNELVVSW